MGRFLGWLAVVCGPRQLPEGSQDLVSLAIGATNCSRMGRISMPVRYCFVLHAGE
jgi:hypothetical protein